MLSLPFSSFSCKKHIYANSVDPNKMTCNMPFHQDLNCQSILDFLSTPLFATTDVSKSKDGRVHFRNAGVKGLKSARTSHYPNFPAWTGSWWILFLPPLSGLFLEPVVMSWWSCETEVSHKGKKPISYRQKWEKLCFLDKTEHNHCLVRACTVCLNTHFDIMCLIGGMHIQNTYPESINKQDVVTVATIS